MKEYFSDMCQMMNSGELERAMKIKKYVRMSNLAFYQNAMPDVAGTSTADG